MELKDDAMGDGNRSQGQDEINWLVIKLGENHWQTRQAKLAHFASD